MVRVCATLLSQSDYKSRTGKGSLRTQRVTPTDPKRSLQHCLCRVLKMCLRAGIQQHALNICDE